MTALTHQASSPNLVRPDQLAFTVLSAGNGRPLAKRFWLDESGELKTETAAQLSNGEAILEYAPSLAQFAERLEQLQTHQAVVYGITSVPRARVVTQKEFYRLSFPRLADVITRTREYLQFAPAPGIAMLDLDAAGAEAGLLGAIGSPDKTRDLLIMVLPELAEAPMLWRPSSSSFLYDGAREVHGLRGQRIYIAVDRASDIPMLGELLYERLWLLGHGSFVVSGSGQLLDRTVVDRAVWQPERLDFAAGPICEPPLERRLPTAKLWNSEAPFFNARSVAGLTPQQKRSIQAKRTAAKNALRDTARARRREWARERGRTIAVRSGIGEGRGVEIAAEAVEQQVLRPDFVLTHESGEIVLLSELLANPDRWHGHRFCDPLEPDYRGDNRVAWANLRPARGRPYLHSHAHGGTRYILASSRRTIALADGQLPRIIDECAEIIAETGEVYQLKDQIVRVTDEGRLAPVEPEWITDWLQRNADFVRPKKIDGTWQDRPTDLPPKYSRTILAKRGEMELPNLVAVTNGPFLRPDGSVVDEPGYDEATQVLYCQTQPNAPRVSEAPTLETAHRVLLHLWSPFQEFPFATDIDRGSVLALLLTAAIRPSIAVAPGGLIESHEAGSGKTLLAQSIANLTGAAAIPQALAQSEEEIRKALFSAARAGAPSVFYDNVGRDRGIDSASLAMALTSGVIADRILGESTHASVPFRPLMLLTGNNTRVAGDLNRRLLRVRITPKVENPWTRVFDFDPRARTEVDWLGLRISALELIRAMLMDGPPSLSGGSGYPDWDRLIRATVCWVALRLDIGIRFADPIRSLLIGYDDDPERDRLRRLLTGWDAAWESESKTVRQVLDAVEENPLASEGAPSTTRAALDQVKEAFQEIDGKRSTHAIGIYLHQQKGRIVDGLELISDGKSNGSSRWAVRRVGTSPPEVPPIHAKPDNLANGTLMHQLAGAVDAGVAT